MRVELFFSSIHEVNLTLDKCLKFIDLVNDVFIECTDI